MKVYLQDRLHRAEPIEVDMSKVFIRIQCRDGNAYALDSIDIDLVRPSEGKGIEIRATLGSLVVVPKVSNVIRVLRDVVLR